MKNFVQKSAHEFQALNPKFKNVIEQVLRVVKKTFIKVLLLLDKLIMYVYIRIVFLLIVVYIVADKLAELIKEVKSKNNATPMPLEHCRRSFARATLSL